MIKAETIEQYHVIQWLEQNFYTDSLEVKLVSGNAISIEDMSGDKAMVIYNSKGDIVLDDDIKEATNGTNI